MARKNNKTTVYRAKWVVPVSSIPIENGVVVTDGEQVVDIGKANDVSIPADSIIVKVDDGVIIPGLVNAHTHLEFSDLQSPIGTAGMAFTDWVRQVIRFKIDHDSLAKASAIKLGVAELVSCGTVAVGEIATDPFETGLYTAQAEKSEPLHKTVFLEQLGGNESQLAAKRIRAEEFTSSAIIEKQSFQPALSPHAPYSVPPQLLQQLVDLSGKFNVRLAMHLAESPQEIELLDHQSGPFVDLLKELGVWNVKDFTHQRNVNSILNSLSLAPDAMIVHGNYLTAKQLDFIQSKPNMQIVFCPRTHQYFNHSRYPLKEILDRSITLAVGTDSRSSNPDLNVLEELKQVARSFPEVDRDTILKMGTFNGASALGAEDQFGSIEIGKSDQLAVVKSASLDSPLGWLDDESSHSLPIGRMS